MQKEFTVNIPDELWVDSWENELTTTYTYEGPQNFYLGIDDNKSQWTYEAYKDYSRLPHGKYTFTLEAKNKYGNSGEISRLEFEIQPPWYESRLLQFVYGLLILLFLAGLVYFPRIRLREKVKVLEDVQEKSKDEIIQLNSLEIIEQTIGKKGNRKNQYTELKGANHSMMQNDDTDFPYWQSLHPKYMKSMLKWIKTL